MSTYIRKRQKPQNIIAQIKKNIKSKQWQCLIDGCDELAINSHLIQQNGILNNITIDGHLIELKMVDAYKWNKNEAPITFQRIGIKHALTHKVFCNYHDTSIFQPIENQNTDFEKYESFLLFSFRAVCAEIRKKTISIEQYTRMINANTLTGIIDKDRLQEQLDGNALGITDLNVLKKELEDEINNMQGSYTFYSFKYPKLDIYASAVFSATGIDFSRDNGDLDLENIYIHILPLNENLLILVGFNNKFTSEATSSYCKSWGGLSNAELEIKLTTLVSTNIENWGTSLTRFENIKEHNKKKYISALIENINYFGITEVLNFNLFE